MSGMLQFAHQLVGQSLQATDGELGTVADVLFDDARWALRYLVVETGGWVDRRAVLVSPMAVRGVKWQEGVIRVQLTKEQVRSSPDIGADMPVSRQHEVDFAAYYQYPLYWEGSMLWGMGAYPVGLLGGNIAVPPAGGNDTGKAGQGRPDHQLSSMREVRHYGIKATDGDIGQVEDFILDEATWAIRYLVVDTRRFLPGGRKVLLSPEWITSISWPDHEVAVRVAREAVRASPQVDMSKPPLRAEEEALYRHYGEDPPSGR